MTPKRRETIVAELNLAWRPHLNVVDGTVSMIEGGPWQGEARDTGLIIASQDRVAADIVGLGVIKSLGKWDKVTKKDVWDQRQIKRAIELRLGRGKDGVELLAASGDGSFDELIRQVRKETGL